MSNVNIYFYSTFQSRWQTKVLNRIKSATNKWDKLIKSSEGRKKKASRWLIWAKGQRKQLGLSAWFKNRLILMGRQGVPQCGSCHWESSISSSSSFPERSRDIWRHLSEYVCGNLLRDSNNLDWAHLQTWQLTLSLCLRHWELYCSTNV